MTLREQLEQQIASLQNRFDMTDGADEGGGWLQLSSAEEWVFQIDRSRFARMVMTYDCYEAFKLISGNPAWDSKLIEAERRRRPGWCGDVPGEDEFSDFAKALGGLTYREAHAIWCKHDFWLNREGVTRFRDE